MEQVFWIEGRLPGLNEIINADRANRFLGAKLKKDSLAIVQAYIRKFHIKPMESPISIEITWYEPNKKRDKDNIASGGTKILCDALVAERIIKNDGWNDIDEFVHHFGLDRVSPHITVKLKGELNDTEGSHYQGIKEK